MTVDELRKELKRLAADGMFKRVQRATEQMKNTREIRTLRNKIAVMATVLGEKEFGTKAKPGIAVT